VDTANKVAKVEQVDPTAGLLNGAAEAVADVAMEEPAVPQEDPIVYGEFSAQFFVSSQTLKRNKVNGNPMPYSQVTEAEHDLMTPEEYTAFFQIMQEQM
jgi:transcription initiation factor TFIIE subunit alpha